MTVPPLVCQRAANLRFPPVPSVPGNCILCKVPVWVVNSSPKGHPIWCWECAGMEIAKAEREGFKPEFERPTEAQMADLAAFFNKRGR